MREKVLSVGICAIVIVLFGFETGLIDYHADASEADNAPATQKGCKYEPRDDLGRCPLLNYKIVMGQNDAVCNKITEAFNHAPAGAHKLYSDPVFLY
jgi:hypothetical protein